MPMSSIPGSAFCLGLRGTFALGFFAAGLFDDAARGVRVTAVFFFAIAEHLLLRGDRCHLPAASREPTELRDEQRVGNRVRHLRVGIELLRPTLRDVLIAARAAGRA